jgi:hypothetical protein
MRSMHADSRIFGLLGLQCADGNQSWFGVAQLMRKHFIVGCDLQSKGSRLHGSGNALILIPELELGLACRCSV